MSDTRCTADPPQATQLLDDPAVLEFRKYLQSCEGKGWEHFDDVAFKISAGGLALSLTLLGVMKNVIPASMWWVLAAWIWWATSLLTLMLSISTAQSGLASQIRHLDAGDYYGLKHPEGALGRLTAWLNYIVVATCMLGLVCLVEFALMNLPMK